MPEHTKEYAVFFKDKNGKAYKQYSVISKKKQEVEKQAKAFSILYNMEFSHIVKQNDTRV